MNRFNFSQQLQQEPTPLTSFVAPQISQSSIQQTQNRFNFGNSSGTDVLTSNLASKLYKSQAVQGALEVLNIPSFIAEEATKKATSGLKPTNPIAKYGPLVAGFGASLINPESEVSNVTKADSAVSKLISALKEAKPASKELAALQSLERGKRAGAAGAILKQAQGEKGYFQALGKLKGPLVPEKPAFEGLRTGETPKLGQSDVDELFKKVQQYPELDVYEKINASSGLQKIFNGTIPQPNQLSLLEDIFGNDLITTVMTKRPLGQKIKDIAAEILNVPRAIITSFDMSAPLRQGIIFTTTRPKTALGAGQEMFRQAFSQKNFDEWLLNLKKEPIYKLAKDSKLYIAEPYKAAGGLAAKEERFMTNIAERLPGIGQIVKASNRAYTGYLNKIRIDVFKDLSNKFIKQGLDPKTDFKVFNDLADFINNATGRGSLPQALNRGAALWNSVFFSPRLIASRANMLNPTWYLKQSPQVRREAIKSFAEFIGLGATVLGIAKAGGAKVELDPRSTDFGKIRVGNIRWDIWGGFQQWVRVFSQLASGERKTAKGEILPLSAKKYPFETRLDVAARFFRGKLAPIPGLALELLEGQKLFGDPLTIDQKILDNSVPLYLQDIKDAMKELGPQALFEVGIPGFFGVGTQTYKEKQKVPKGNRFNF